MGNCYVLVFDDFFYIVVYVFGIYESIILRLFCVFVAMSINAFLNGFAECFWVVIFVKICLSLFRICLQSWDDFSFMILFVNLVTILFFEEIVCSDIDIFLNFSFSLVC